MRQIEAVHITIHNLQNVGGAQESTRNLLGFAPAHWTVVSPCELPADIACDTIQTPRLTRVPLLRSLIPSGADMQRAVKRIVAIQPDILLVNHPDPYTTPFYLALPEELQRRAAIIWRGDVTARANMSPDLTRKAIKQITWPMFTLLRRYIGNHAGVNLAISQAVASSLVRIGVRPEKIKVIPNQVGGEFTPELRLRSEGRWREKYLEPDQLGVLVVSRISPEKGLEWVIELLQQLRRERKHLVPEAAFRKVKITLAGGAVESTQWIKEWLLREAARVTQQYSHDYAAHSITFKYLGPQGREELQKLYNAYDILFMPSPAEGFGRVTAESMSAGMTVMGRSQCPATAEILQEPPYTTGILVVSPVKAAGEIMRLMNDRQLLAQLQHNALQWAGGRFSLQNAANAFWEATLGQSVDKFLHRGDNQNMGPLNSAAPAG